jgi:pimeloyl-[acyl-carrier protein] methyl ester esterase
MHGTSELMDDFQATAPNDAHVDVVALPNHMSDYSELASYFERTLRLTPDAILIAESFSGPLAIMLAARAHVRALILCNTFATAPYSSMLGLFPLSLIARIPPPSFFVRYFIVGADAPDSMVEQVRKAVERVPPGTLASRARSALKVDVRRELAQCTCPILYLQGTEDHVVHQRSVDAIVRAASVPVTVVRIAGPHLVLKTAPREAWSAIESFLQDASAKEVRE